LFVSGHETTSQKTGIYICVMYTHLFSEFIPHTNLRDDRD